MRILIDGADVEVTVAPGALARDLVAEGFWLDGRFVAPDDPLALHRGAAVTTAPPAASAATAFVLDLVGGLRAGRSYPLPRRAVVVGRAPDCDIVLDDPTVSPHHAVIDEHHDVRDLGSVNGTMVDGNLIRFGATQARIRPRREDRRTAGPFNRPPRVPLPPPAEPPVAPETPPPRSFGGVRAIAAPLLVAGALVMVYGDARFALVALVGPIAGLVAFRAPPGGRVRRRSHRRTMAAHRRALADHDAHERARLELLAPDPCVMTRHLWARRCDDDDFGVVRLGMRGNTPVIACGAVGVAGDRAAALAVARSLVCQMAVHHGPADLRICVDEGPDWEWASWLPHTADAPAVFQVAVAATTEQLPATCTTVVEVDDLGDAGGFVACGMQEAEARELARWLGRFDDPHVAMTTALPREVRMSEVEGIGVARDGFVDVDLVRDGPHALVAGTTGSGKSELLRTLIARLASRHSPDELVFVLIDYKGGSAFDDCARLPHCVGLVTDLDEHLGARALRSLEAELRHRERTQRAGGPTEPRLVVVVDEFATLAGELPDFLGALVGIAQRGRSLGMHLVLATQRPSGAVNAHIKANTNLRIALRVQDAADSVDVIDSPEAATIGRDTPGRAYLRRGSGDVVLVQTAISSRPVRHGPPVTVRPFAAPDDDAVTDDAPTELHDIVERLRQQHPPPARRPWLPMLPDHLELGAIDPPAFALADEPDRQRRVPVAWDPAEGNLALFGMVGSGTTTAMRAAVERLADAFVYEIDFGFGAAERHARLLRLLRATLDERRASHGSAHRPLIVTCIDGVGAFLAEHDGVDGMDVSESFHRLFAEGPEFGIVFVVTGDRPSALPLRLSTLVHQKLFFRLADPHDYALIGVRPAELPRFVPGRAIHADGNRVVQVGLPAPRARRARTIRTLPDRIDVRDLPPGAIGLDDDLEPVWLTGCDDLLVTGPRRSGKTTALHTIAPVLTDHLLVDDALEVVDIDRSRPIVAAARADEVRTAHAHWLRDVRRSRTGLLLQPDLLTDGDLLGVRLPRRLHTPLRPGRGFLVVDGEARLVQLATRGP